MLLKTILNSESKDAEWRILVLTGHGYGYHEMVGNVVRRIQGTQVSIQGFRSSVG